jgi:hypothetical protein
MRAKLGTLLSLVFVSAACTGNGASGGHKGQHADAGDEAADMGCGCGLDWQIDNLALCVVRQTGFTAAAVYTSHLDSAGMPQCDPARAVPQPVPLDPWSAHRIKSACAGSGRLCVALRQGSMDADGGLSSSCTLSEVCTDVDYVTPGSALELPPLAAWSVADADCANSYDEGSGFFEFRLTSDEFSCGAENPTLVSVRPSCPPGCDLEPQAERCKVCDLCPSDCAAGSTESRCIACGGSGNGAIATF